jgi:MFS family permease
MSQWVSAFAESGLGVSKTVGDLAGPLMFAVLMGTSRVLYSKFSETVNLKAFMAGSCVLSVVGYLLASTSPNPVLALIGCGLCGLACGILWPGTFSLASAHFKKGGTAMFALLAVAGDLGCSAGPALVGVVAEASSRGLNAGMFAAIIFPVLMLAVFLLIKMNNNHVQKSHRQRDN